MNLEEERTLKRLRWACRRGMLELDLFLINYVDHEFERLSPQAQDTFRALLEENDSDLFAWLMGYETPKPRFKEMIKQIRYIHDQSTDRTQA